jgi:hypothetical protein
MDEELKMGEVLSALGALVGSIFWFARLEGRVNTAEQRHLDLKEDVTYIRERIDHLVRPQTK